MGAGPAGLTAAYELLMHTQIRPVIIEMGAQVGGLSKTINYKGNLIDIGGHRFFSKSEKITDWWLEFLPLETPDTGNPISLTYQNKTTSLKPHANENIYSSGRMMVRQRKSRIYYNHAFFDYPLSLNGKTIRNFGMIKICRIGFSYTYAKIFPQKKEDTLEQFFINRFGNELYKTFFKGYTEKIWGVTCNEIPADWGRQRIKDLNIGRILSQAFTSLFSKNKSLNQKGISTSLIEQFLYPQKGPGQMWETVAAKILALGGEIRLNTKVEKINTDKENRICSVKYKDLVTDQLSELNGEHFFSTIPVKHLIRGLQPIAIPDNIKQIAGDLAYRDFMIVGLLFKKAENQKGTIAGLTDNWIYLQDQHLVAGRLQIFNNWSPYMVKDKGNLWVGMEYFCRTTDPIWSMDQKEMIQFAYQELKRTGLITAEELLDGTVIRIPKAYPSYIGAYDQFEKVQSWLDCFDNLYLIGRNGMHRYNNTDHSMMTAMTAVENIVKNEKSRTNIWAVNMEVDFHEEKPSGVDG